MPSFHLISRMSTLEIVFRSKRKKLQESKDERRAMLDEKNIGNYSSSLFNGNHFPSIYIVRANFILITRKVGGAYFEIAARTLCLRVCGATLRFTAAVKIPLPRQHFSSRILFDRKFSESYFF